MAPLIDKLEIRADEHKLQQVDDKQLTVGVVDTGISIAPENQQKVFEDFFQVKNNIKDKTPGLSLMLGLNRRLIEMHGGRIGLKVKVKVRVATLSL